VPVLSIPFDAFVGLVLANTGTEVTFPGYAREAATFAWCADGVTIANTLTLEWDKAQAEWGGVSSVQVWDSPAGGGVMFGATFPTSDPGPVHQYAIPRIQAGALAMQEAWLPVRGYGTGPFGTGHYVTGLTLRLVSAGVPLEITFDSSTHVCEPGTWAPGPFKAAA
jgi:hypothetical protein